MDRSDCKSDYNFMNTTTWMHRPQRNCTHALIRCMPGSAQDMVRAGHAVTECGSSGGGFPQSRTWRFSKTKQSAIQMHSTPCNTAATTAITNHNMLSEGMPPPGLLCAAPQLGPVDTSSNLQLVKQLMLQSLLMGFHHQRQWPARMRQCKRQRDVVVSHHTVHVTSAALH